jgi:GNAT superfamily N-acetyltransferase
MTALTDSDLYARGAETMLATWEEYARGAADAAVRRLPGVTAGVFPCGPERAFYNNALLERDLGAAERADAVEAMEAAYTAGGVTRFAAWVHESDAPMKGDLEQRGYTLQETTRAMGMALVGTLEHARRRGLGTALTTIALHDARDRGCKTASVQSTEMAEGVYAAAGFRDLGRFLEYGPRARSPRANPSWAPR